MNICIEGPDNAGKSTLVEALAEIYDREVVHATKPESNDDAYHDYNEEIYESGQLILDRSQAISGMIYDFHVRKHVPFFGMKDVEQLAASTLLIICLPPKELVLGDMKRDQMPGVRENHEALYNAYADLADGNKIGHYTIFTYDYTKHGVVYVMNWIEEMLGGPIY